MTITLFCGVILFLVLGILISVLFYKRNNKITYSISNFFPFEFNYKTGFKGNLPGNCFLILSFIFAFIFLLISETTYLSGTMMIPKILGTITIIFVSLLFIVPFSHGRGHNVAFCLAIGISFGFCCGLIYSTYQTYKLMNTTYYLILLILCFVSLAAVSILFLNPKFSFRFNAIRDVDENGNEVFKRPKVITYALTEWILIFINVFNLLLYLLVTINLM